MKFKIRKGDTVEVISGRAADKGEQGEVLKVYREKQRVTVQGINIRKKHQGQIQAQGRTMTPGIIEFEGPIHISNVMLVCPSCGKPTRVGISREDGKAHRVCKRCCWERKNEQIKRALSEISCTRSYQRSWIREYYAVPQGHESCCEYWGG